MLFLPTGLALLLSLRFLIIIHSAFSLQSFLGVSYTSSLHPPLHCVPCDAYVSILGDGELKNDGYSETMPKILLS